MFNQSSASNGSVLEPGKKDPFAPPAPGQVQPGAAVPLTSQHFIAPEPKPVHNIVETLILIAVTLVAVIFIYLFISKYAEWDTLRTDIDGQINSAVALAVADNTTKMEETFLEREKYPYRSFMGPADYGSLAFEYPKTWNVFVSKDATDGDNFEAYFNPGQVEPLSMTMINAFRVTISNTSFDSSVIVYNNLAMEGELQFTTRTIGGVLANVYTGFLPFSNLKGAIAVFKLRDKTVMLQTDAEIFLPDFYKVLDSVTVIQ